jgi:hypothetical protein
VSDTVLDELRNESRNAYRLAILASVAARVDRSVLRRLRLRILEDADATAESDLWFSRAVAVRSSDGIMLATEVLETLRELLVCSGRLEAARGIVRDVHAGAAPLHQLEQDLIELALSDAPTIDIERRLSEALVSIRVHRERARDIADWALMTLPRLPARVRSTAAAWSLALAAEAELGYAVTLGADVPDGHIDIDPSTPMTTMGVARTAGEIVLGTSAGAELPVHATMPRIVRVEIDDEPVMASIVPGTVWKRPVTLLQRVVLSNLKGERWEAVSRPSQVVAELDASENGKWVLVDGTAEFRLPALERELAEALGIALARNGYSLITLGRQGISHVVARAFMTELGARGFTSGIYRLLHVVESGERPDYWEHGRALFAAAPNTIAGEAVERAHAIVTIGSSPALGELELLALGKLPLEKMALRFPFPGRMVSDDIDDVMMRLRSSLALPRPARGYLAELVHRAAIALDQRDLEAYNNELHALSQAATSAELDVQALVRDDRASYRLVGYLTHARLPWPTMVDALKAERECVLAFWETRTLWHALESVSNLDLPTFSESEIAVSAACVSIKLELDGNELIDPGGEVKQRLEQVLEARSSGRRALELGTIAFTYEDLRSKLPAGDERTRQMENIVEDVRSRFASSSTAVEASVWFSSDRPGQRVVALALLLATRDPAGYTEVADSIAAMRTPFEQFTALRVADAMLELLPESAIAAIRDATELARRPGGEIDLSDTTRWNLSSRMLARIRRMLGENLTFERGRAVVVINPELRSLPSTPIADGLVEAGFEVSLLHDPQATPETLAEHIRSAAAAAPSTLVLAYAGDSALRDGELSLLLGEGFLNIKYIVSMIPETIDVVLLLDCDYAGAAARALHDRRDVSAGTRMLIASCGAGEHAASDGQFAFAIDRALRQAPRPPDGVISAVEVFERMRDSLRRLFTLKIDQHPECTMSGPSNDLALGRGTRSTTHETDVERS